MTKYAEVAIRTAGRLRQRAEAPEKAWRVSAAEVFSEASTSAAKNCPRGAFLGLYEAGLISGVTPLNGVRHPASVNGQYAVAAAGLMNDPGLAATSKAELWRRTLESVGADVTKKHNGQLDVVEGLHQAGLLAVSQHGNQ